MHVICASLPNKLSILTEGFDNDTALIQASFAGETAVVKLLLSCEADIEHVNKSGNTALTEAIANGHPDIVSLLLKHGAVDRRENMELRKSENREIGTPNNLRC